MTSEEIIAALPYQYPFLFVDEILSVDDNMITGTFTYDPQLPFYAGHFKNNPITPGVILTETMAQIGLVAFGINMTGTKSEDARELKVAMTSTEINFYKPVYPGEKVTVKSEKEYFRMNKLKCKVEMYNDRKELVCKGTIAGMMIA